MLSPILRRFCSTSSKQSSDPNPNPNPDPENEIEEKEDYNPKKSFEKAFFVDATSAGT